MCVNLKALFKVNTSVAVILRSGSMVNIFCIKSNKSSEAAINISLSGVAGHGLNWTKSGKNSIA